MEGFLVHVPETESRSAAAELKQLGSVIKLSTDLFAVRTDTSAQALLQRLAAAMPKGAPVLVARTNGAYFHGDPGLAGAAKLLA